MLDYSVDQSADIQPPRAGQSIAIAVTSTSQGYDLTKLLGWNEENPTAQAAPAGTPGQKNLFFLSMQALSNDVWILLDYAPSGTNSVTDAPAGQNTSPLTLPAPSSIGGTAPYQYRVFSAAQPGERIVQGIPSQDLRIDRIRDRTLIVKCASGNSGTLVLWPSSKNMPSVSGSNPA